MLRRIFGILTILAGLIVGYYIVYNSLNDKPFDPVLGTIIGVGYVLFCIENGFKDLLKE